VPEEFRDWVIARVQDMLSAVAERRAVLNASFEHLLFEADVPRDASPSREDSKKFAATARAQAGDDFNLMMSLWRGHEIASTLWREIRPEHELPYRAVDESVA
jgi:hypothetical protein